MSVFITSHVKLITNACHSVGVNTNFRQFRKLVVFVYCVGAIYKYNGVNEMNHLLVLLMQYTETSKRSRNLSQVCALAMAHNKACCIFFNLTDRTYIESLQH